MKLPLIAGALCAFAPVLAAQQSVVFDDGTTGLITPNSSGSTIQAAGSLSTGFASNNQFAGNMIDIAPTVDMEITGLDVNILQAGIPVDIEVWYIPGTSVGNEASSAGWTLIGTYSNPSSAGQDLPTFVDMSGNGVTFSGGSTYGLFIYADYSAGQTMRYTNGSGAGTGPGGADQWSNADLTITANCGKGNPGFTGSTFKPRNWSGTMYYETGGFNLTVTNLVAGSAATAATSGAAPGTTVIVAYSLRGGGPTNTVFGPVDLSLPIQQLPPATADGAGNTSTTANIPAGATGVPVWIQAVNITGPGTGVLSNSMAMTIG